MYRTTKQITQQCIKHKILYNNNCMHNTLYNINKTLLITNNNIHCNLHIRYMTGYTGISFQPIPEEDIKIMQWMKKKEIEHRKNKMNNISKNIWHNNQHINFRNITMKQAKQLLDAALDSEPSHWQIKQFYTNTLQQYAPYRLFEEQQKRKQLVEQKIDEIFDEIRYELRNTKRTVEYSKNDLTMKLEDKLGELPTSDEVDWLWQDRFKLPLVKWIGE